MRRNKVASAASLPTEDLARKRRRRAPKLPTLVVGQERPWHPLTLAFWREVWRSPMAGQFLAADVHGLYVLALLVDEFWLAPTKEMASEIRQQRMCFGLTPLDRRRLAWQISADPPSRRLPPKDEESSAGGQHAAEQDPRALLHVV